MIGFSSDHNMIALVEHKQNPQKRLRGLMSLGFFLAAILIGSLELVPLSIAFLMAAILTVLFKGINLQKAYENIDWRLLILIAGMTAFGVAMTKTGTDRFLAENIVSIFNPLGVIGILAGFMVLTVLLTQPMSNAAAALVVLPVALETANQLGSNPRTFAIMVMLAASVSLITPFEPACILVYGPGKYKFFDFLKTGGILTLILMAILLFMVPMFWSL
jgi:di/tricarboxylate transporter